MQTVTQRPNRRPKLFLPAFLAAPAAPAPKAETSFPLSPDQLRRAVAERIG
ncbi:MAG TPA: hypothetical protein VH331_17430 [Allosphingosinicella sp.]|jgi:hypothetical protein|nr:hypothetical protein [Allosphingosinicella sp.]